ncbi:MAG TPA: serine hydrolase domain-containing protein [Opitutaceae bacterium]|nr:serine hydrolase domain-containing protein [Opitutaceae bacterium]
MFGPSRLLTSVALLTSVVLHAGCYSSPSPRHLDAITLEQLGERLKTETKRAPGVVFGAVWRDGTIVIRAAGAADLRSGGKMEPETPFALYSVTKLFTATAVMQLSERGRIKLDAPVSQYLPDVRLRRDGQEATVRDLLTHMSGLPNPLPVRWVHVAGEAGPTLDEMIRRKIGAEPRLHSVPGTKCAYSNLGYLLLGKIVERASGMPYTTYVESNVLAPLGCPEAGFAVPADRATGYQRKWSLIGLLSRFLFDKRFIAGSIDGYWEIRPITVDGAPYGGLNGPVSCLLEMASMMMHDGMGRNGRVLSAASVREMLEPSQTRDGRTMGIGLGWYIDSIDGERFAVHEGGGGGWRSELRVYPDRGYAVAVLRNATWFDTDGLARVVILDPPRQPGH